MKSSLIKIVGEEHQQWRSLGSFASLLLTALGLPTPATGEVGTPSAAINTWGTIAGGGYADGTSDNTDPKAFVTIVLFDKNYNFLDVAYAQLKGTSLYYMTSSYTVKEAGYAYLYVSNEQAAQTDVYFDDVTMTYTPTQVIQNNEYYPFGLQTAESWTRSGTTNNFLYDQGSEVNTTTGYYDLPYRNYDPALGRFFQVDAMATTSHNLTPYHYAGNNPIGSNDPTGLWEKSPFESDNPVTFGNGYETGGGTPNNTFNPGEDDIGQGGGDLMDETGISSSFTDGVSEGTSQSFVDPNYAGPSASGVAPALTPNSLIYYIGSNASDPLNYDPENEDVINNMFDDSDVTDFDPTDNESDPNKMYGKDFRAKYQSVFGENDWTAQKPDAWYGTTTQITLNLNIENRNQQESWLNDQEGNAPPLQIVSYEIYVTDPQGDKLGGSITGEANTGLSPFLPSYINPGGMNGLGNPITYPLPSGNTINIIMTFQPVMLP